MTTPPEPRMAEPLDREAQWTIYVCEECHQPHGDPRRFCRHEPHGVLSRLPADYRALRKVRVVHKTALLAAEQRAEEAERERDGLKIALKEARPYVFNRVEPLTMTNVESWRSETARGVLIRVDAALAPHKAAEEETDG